MGNCISRNDAVVGRTLAQPADQSAPGAVGTQAGPRRTTRLHAAPAVPRGANNPACATAPRRSKGVRFDSSLSTVAQDVLQHRELAGNVGLFLDFFLPYDSRNRESPRQQAQSMLNMAEAIIHEGNAPGVAITFSANQNQSQKIHDSYRRNQWFTEIEGPNQGEVMRHVETLQRDSAQYIGLQGQVHIAPITTVYNDDQDDGDINRGVRSDLEKIKSDYLDRGWVVLGWQNQDSVAQGSARYAIGGGLPWMHKASTGFETRIPTESRQLWRVIASNSVWRGQLELKDRSLRQ